MKFLLFFVSFIFSIIFYFFHKLSNWKNIFWNDIHNTNINNTPNAFGNTIQDNLIIGSFSWNLLIESFIFLFIGIFFLYIFSDLKSKWQSKLRTYKIEILYFMYYIIFIYYIYFLSKWIGSFNKVLIVIFVCFDIIFNHLSQLPSLYKYKINLRYIWLIINYLTILISIYLIRSKWVHFIPVYILIYNIFFNTLIHKKYTNYISLFMSILTTLFLIYSLFFFLIKKYI